MCGKDNCFTEFGWPESLLTDGWTRSYDCCAKKKSKNHGLPVLCRELRRMAVLDKMGWDQSESPGCALLLDNLQFLYLLTCYEKAETFFALRRMCPP